MYKACSFPLYTANRQLGCLVGWFVHTEVCIVIFVEVVLNEVVDSFDCI